MIVVNGLKACDACRAAVKALDAAGRAVALRDLRADPPAPEELRRWDAAFGAALLNRRSTTWRALGEAERAGDPLALMAAHPTLIKRPVIEAEGGPHLGWDDATRAALGL
jgi:arsenate reductase-like glutaredoxin family protein